MPATTIDTTDAFEALPAAPARVAAGPRERLAAHALAADIARLHGEALLRTARRWSTCADDAHDAYQRAMELLLAHASTIDRSKALGWMQVVVRREAGLIRRAHDRTVPLDADDEEIEATISRLSATTDEHVHALDLAQRAGEALASLKETQAQALCLRAQGLSYEEIGEAYGWSYTKVNRAVTEGRRAFVAYYEAVERGAICSETADLLSRFVAGELRPATALKVRGHLIRCSACRALLHAERQADLGLRALLPPAAIGTVTAVRTGWLQDHLLAPLGHLAGRIQPAVDHLVGGKLAVVAASTLALAGSGVAVEHQVRDPKPTARLGTALAAQPAAPKEKTTAAAAPAATPASVMTTAIDRSDAIAAAQERKAAAARKRAVVTRRRAAARAAAKHEFSPAGGEFATSTKRSATAARRATTDSSAAASAPAAEVPVGEAASDSSIAATPDAPSSSAPSSDAVSDEFGP